MEDMIHDLDQEGFWKAHAPYYEKLQTDSQQSLYLGCTTFTRLSAVLTLVNLKAKFGWSDKSFIELLVLLKNMLPNDNILSKSTRKFMHALMIVFYTKINLRKSASARHVGYYATK